MLATSKAYSGIGVDDLDEARRFYGETLGVELKTLDEENGLLELQLTGGDRPTLLYLSPNLTPASYTVLNFEVDDVEAAIDGLVERGVSFERYEAFEQDERGIVQAPGSPRVAWFKDPAGNTLSVLEETS